MFQELQDKIEWSYMYNQILKVIYHYDDEIKQTTIYMTQQFTEDDVFFEELLIGFRKYSKWLKILKKNPYEQNYTNYSDYLHRTAPLH